MNSFRQVLIGAGDPGWINCFLTEVSHLMGKITSQSLQNPHKVCK